MSYFSKASMALPRAARWLSLSFLAICAVLVTPSLLLDTPIRSATADAVHRLLIAHQVAKSQPLLKREEEVQQWLHARYEAQFERLDPTCSAFLQQEAHPPLEIPNPEELGSVSSADATPSIEDIPPRKIFFLSRYHTFPSPLQDDSLCAIEAALRRNPSHRVDVWTPNPADLEALLLDVFTPHGSGNASVRAVAPSVPFTSLQQHFAPPRHASDKAHFLSRLNLRTINDEELFRDTPFESWYRSGAYKDSAWIEQNLGNAARLAILAKEGGTYHDLDMLALNEVPLARSGESGGRGLRRALALQDRTNYYLNNAALTLPAGDPFTWAAMEEFVADFQGHHWGWQGPLLQTRTFRKHCPASSERLGILPPDSPPPSSPYRDNSTICASLAVLDQRRYYPITLFESLDVFPLPVASPDGCDLLDRLRRESLGMHLWHNHVKHETGRWRDGTVYREVVTRSCPAVAWWRETQAAKEAAV